MQLKIQKKLKPYHFQILLSLLFPFQQSFAPVISYTPGQNRSTGMFVLLPIDYI